MTPTNPLRRGASHEAPTVDQLRARADALRSALHEGSDLLDPDAAARARDAAAKVDERTAIVGSHTVVALAGATGSGKSSLFNVLAGTDVAQVGVRRPTTSTPTAAVWGDEPAGSLLDWLGVGRRHVVPAAEVGDLGGLVLVDLPDFDSRERSHREEARRVLELVDVFVWVTDPQKYADAVLHDEYVSVLREYGAVTLVVLNQLDRLPAGGAEPVERDLARLLERDGVRGVELLGTSVVTGEGLDDLRARLHGAVERADATRHRLGADLRTASDGLMGSVGEREPSREDLPTEALVDALARAAGVPTVLDAVARDFRRESHARTGWPFTRWLQALRPAPLRRLRLDQTPGGPEVTERDVRAVLGRSSIPAPAPSARAAVDLAARRLGERAAQDLPPRWADAVTDAAQPADVDLADRLDQAVVATPLRGRQPLWWRVVGLMQLLLAAAVVVGVVWLVLAAVLAWLQLPALPTADVGPFATPFVLLVVGLLGGLVLAALSRWLAARGARRRAATVERRLRRSIGEVADQAVLDPVEAVLRRHASTRGALARVSG